MGISTLVYWARRAYPPKMSPRGRRPPPPEEVIQNAVRLRLIYSLAGLVLGLAFVLLGVFLFVQGVTGSIGWAIQLPGVNRTLTNVASGAPLVVVSLLVVLVTKPQRIRGAFGDRPEMTVTGIKTDRLGSGSVSSARKRPPQ